MAGISGWARSGNATFRTNFALLTQGPKTGLCANSWHASADARARHELCSLRGNRCCLKQVHCTVRHHTPILAERMSIGRVIAVTYHGPRRA